MDGRFIVNLYESNEHLFYIIAASGYLFDLFDAVLV